MIADGIKLTEYSKTELTNFLLSRFWQIDSVDQLFNLISYKNVVWNFVMYVAISRAWNPNVNKGLVWILCIAPKCNLVTLGMVASNSAARKSRPTGTGCCFFSVAGALANIGTMFGVIVYSNTAFELLLSLGCHRSGCRLSQLACKRCHPAPSSRWAPAGKWERATCPEVPRQITACVPSRAQS